jgi:hypothetical protein
MRAVAPGSNVGFQKPFDVLRARHPRSFDRPSGRSESNFRRRLGQRHTVDPTAASIGAQNPPVHVIPLQELDLVAAIENSDLRGADFVRAVEQPNEPIPDLAALECLGRPDAIFGERQRRRRFRHDAQGIGLADLLQRRPAPAREQRLVDDPYALGGAGIQCRGRRGRQQRIRFGGVSVAASFAEDHESCPGSSAGRRGDNRGRQLADQCRQRGVSIK